MIGLLEGEIICKGPTELIIKVGGVGYRVHIPLSTFYALPEPPARISLLIHTRVQEDALNLYGFGTPEEKELFLHLLAIPRIGARMALNILSGISPGEFGQALAQRDIRRLASIPGIGKKSAERIVLELKDKQLAAGATQLAAAPGQGPLQDALSALVNLGYPKNLADKALEAARGQGASTLEEFLRQGLRWLAK